MEEALINYKNDNHMCLQIKNTHRKLLPTVTPTFAFLGGSSRRERKRHLCKESRTMSRKWKLSLKELKKVSYVAAPMVAVTVLQYLMQVVSVMMVGHLDDLSLSGISSASSFTSVTGFSLLVTTSFPFLIGNCN